MSEYIPPLGLAFLLVGALSSGCKGAAADPSLFPDAAPGSSGGAGTPGSLMQGASSSEGQSNPGSGLGGDDAAAATDGGDDAQDDQAQEASTQGHAALDAARPVDDAGSSTAADEAGDDAPSAADDSAAVPDAPVAPDAGTDGLVCANLGCFDFFDCAIFHPAEIGPCGFTKCVNLVCQ